MRDNKTEKIERRLMKKNENFGVFIGTAFDIPKMCDPAPPPLRSSEPTTLSHRIPAIQFKKASD